MSWDRIYRLALHAFPRAFRRRWSDAMQADFRDGLRAARREGRHRSFAVRELRNAIATGLDERFHLDPRQLQMLHLSDIRYAARLLTRSPGFSLLTVLVLGGGLGLATFTFSFLYTAMVKPLPLSDGDRIVRVMQYDGGRRTPLDAFDIAVARTELRTVGPLVPYTRVELILGEAGARRTLDATATDPALFALARVPAHLGRPLLPSDSEVGAESVVVLTYRIWETAFGADRDVIGRTIPLNGASVRVVGVMPAGFGFPVAAEAWLPLNAAALSPQAPGISSYQLATRLAPGVRTRDAEAELGALLQRLRNARDTTQAPGAVGGVKVESFASAQFGDERPIVFGVLNLVALLILLLAVVNVTTLLLARANERVRETAVRMALGATVPRLVMQGLWEAILLCVAGGLVGTATASWGLDAITRWTRHNMEGNLTFWWVWQMDRVTLVVAGVCVTLTIALLGAVIVRRATRANVREVLQDGSARGGARREGRLARRLVAGQIATLTLLMYFGVISGLLARRFVSLDVGFDTRALMQGWLQPPVDRYPTSAARQEVLTRIANGLRDQTSVASVLLRSTLATSGSLAFRGNGVESRTTARLFALDGALETTGITMIEGRPFSTSDDAEHEPVAIVSRSLAARLSPGQSPIGRQLRLASVGDTARWHTVVGVANDIPYGDPWARDRSPDAAYLPLRQTTADAAVALVRHRGSEVDARAAILQATGAVDPLLVPAQLQSYRAVIEGSRLVAAGTTKLFGAAFAFALVLAVAGSYGLMARSIGLRTREIGVRRALGASESMMTRLLLASGARQLGVGALVALAPVALAGAAFNHFFPVGWVSTVLAALLVPLAIVGVVLAATWVPTRRVLRVTPRDALWRD